MDDDEIGRIDLHYTNSVTYATLAVVESLTEDEIRSLISEIDERLVLTNDPFREDFMVTVWTGREYANYSDEDFEDELDDDEGDEEGGSGGRQRRSGEARVNGHGSRGKGDPRSSEIDPGTDIRRQAWAEPRIADHPEMNLGTGDGGLRERFVGGKVYSLKRTDG